ncbi:hypothetical protein ABVT39_025506 [Epinephelus coioides]
MWATKVTKVKQPAHKESPSAPGLRLASTQLPLSSRPVVAMPKTIQALSELGALWENSSTKDQSSPSDDPRPRPVQSSVRERFLLKLKLRKKSKKKYEVVKTRSGGRQEPMVFDCWFCGRLFNSQEDWIGHGQRHLMEATRDWNKLF